MINKLKKKENIENVDSSRKLHETNKVEICDDFFHDL